MDWNAFGGNDMANAFTLMGCRAVVRRGITVGRPMPLYGLGGNG